MAVKWIDKRARLPGPGDLDAAGCALCWHVYQGAMMQGAWNIEHNRFITHWAPAPQRPEGAEEPEDWRIRAALARNGTGRGGETADGEEQETRPVNQ